MTEDKLPTKSSKIAHTFCQFQDLVTETENGVFNVESAVNDVLPSCKLLEIHNPCVLRVHCSVARRSCLNIMSVLENGCGRTVSGFHQTIDQGLYNICDQIAESLIPTGLLLAK